MVGTTAAGKTTIAKLLARFYDPTAGRVLLDGVDLRDLDEPTLRRAVVMVTQENYMFGGTVADNIRFGRPDATTEEVVGAARASSPTCTTPGWPPSPDVGWAACCPPTSST